MKSSSTNPQPFPFFNQEQEQAARNLFHILTLGNEPLSPKTRRHWRTSNINNYIENCCNGLLYNADNPSLVSLNHLRSIGFKFPNCPNNISRQELDSYTLTPPPQPRQQQQNRSMQAQVLLSPTPDTSRQSSPNAATMSTPARATMTSSDKDKWSKAKKRIYAKLGSGSHPDEQRKDIAEIMSLAGCLPQEMTDKLTDWLEENPGQELNWGNPPAVSQPVVSIPANSGWTPVNKPAPASTNPFDQAMATIHISDNDTDDAPPAKRQRGGKPKAAAKQPTTAPPTTPASVPAWVMERHALVNPHVATTGPHHTTSPYKSDDVLPTVEQIAAKPQYNPSHQASPSQSSPLSADPFTTPAKKRFLPPRQSFTPAKPAEPEKVVKTLYDDAVECVKEYKEISGNTWSLADSAIDRLNAAMQLLYDNQQLVPGSVEFLNNTDAVVMHEQLTTLAASKETIDDKTTKHGM